VGVEQGRSREKVTEGKREKLLQLLSVLSDASKGSSPEEFNESFKSEKISNDTICTCH